MTEEDALAWPPPGDASLLGILRAVLSRLDGVGVTPWNVWIEPPRTVMVTLSERPSDALVHEVLSVLAPLHVSPHWHEAFTERADPGSELDGDADYPDADTCSVCGGPGALQLCELDPSLQPSDGTTFDSFWWVCTACRATIATAEVEALRRRLRPEDRTAPYADALVNGLLRALHPRG